MSTGSWSMPPAGVRGWAGRFMARCATMPAAARPLLACEVNEQPPNPASMAFHERFGFAAVGRQETEGGTKQVALMEMPLA